MPSIAIFTFDPQRFEEIIKIRQKEQADRSEKITILGEWCDAKHGRVIRLVQDGDVAEILAAYRTWCDLGTLEIFPVADTKDLIKQ